MASADDASGHRGGKVGGHKNRRLVCQFANELAPGCLGLLCVVTKARRPGQVNQLYRRVQDVAAKHGMRPLTAGMKHAVARGVTGRRLKVDTF